MFSGNDKAILEYVLQMIDEAERVIERYGGAFLALSDFEGKNSILLNLLQIGEKLNKIQSETIRELLPISETYSIRNRITHDYGGIDLDIIENILIEDFPFLKRKIIDLIK
jgi:uncharacterized protein with HEPN domain